MAFGRFFRKATVGPGWADRRKSRAEDLISKESNKPWTAWGDWREKRRNVRAGNILGRVEETTGDLAERQRLRNAALSTTEEQPLQTTRTQQRIGPRIPELSPFHGYEPPGSTPAKQTNLLTEPIDTTEFDEKLGRTKEGDEISGGKITETEFDPLSGLPQLYEAPQMRIEQNEFGTPTGIVDKWGNKLLDTSQLGESISELQRQAPMTLDEFLSKQGYQMTDITQTPEWSGLGSLMEELKGGSAQADATGAFGAAAQAVGLEPGQYKTALSDLNAMLKGGPNEAQGLSPEQLEIREQYYEAEVQELERYQDRMLQNVLGETGSTGRYLAMGDEAVRQIKNARIANADAIAKEDLTRQTAQFDSQMDRYKVLLETGQMAASDYLTLLSQNRSYALEGYAQQIVSMQTQNTHYLQQYGDELERFRNTVDATYKGINAELGLDEQLLNQIDQLTERYYQPYLAEVEAWALDESITAAQRAARRENWGLLFEGLGAVANVISLIPGVGG